MKSLLKRSQFKYLLIPLFLVIITLFFFYTPAGLLGKADAVGYAVCHRIPSHSYFMGDRQLPLCIRCTGMHLGAFLGLVYQLRYGKRGRMPSKKFIVVLGILFIAFAVDGINSYLHLFSNMPWAYEPQNWLRLLTGIGVGVCISAVLYPTFNQTIWIDWVDEPVLNSWRQMIEMIVIGVLLYFLTLSENLLVLYPIALVTSLNVILILTSIYTIIWVLIFKKENAFNNFNELTFFIIAGISSALLQILLMDLARYNITGTWGSFL